MILTRVMLEIWLNRSTSVFHQSQISSNKISSGSISSPQSVPLPSNLLPLLISTPFYPPVYKARPSAPCICVPVKPTNGTCSICVVVIAAILQQEGRIWAWNPILWSLHVVSAGLSACSPCVCWVLSMFLMCLLRSLQVLLCLHGFSDFLPSPITSGIFTTLKCVWVSMVVGISMWLCDELWTIWAVSGFWKWMDDRWMDIRFSSQHQQSN